MRKTYLGNWEEVKMFTTPGLDSNKQLTPYKDPDEVLILLFKRIHEDNEKIALRLIFNY